MYMYVQLWTMYCEWLCVTSVQLWTMYCESLNHCVLHVYSCRQCTMSHLVTVLHMYSYARCTVSGCVLQVYSCGQCTVSGCVTCVQLWTMYCESLSHCVLHVYSCGQCTVSHWVTMCYRCTAVDNVLWVTESLCVTCVQLWTVYCESLSHYVLHVYSCGQCTVSH